MTEHFATSDGRETRVPPERFLTFKVSPEVVEQAQDWSSPVRFRFEKKPDGTVEMWLQNVEAA